MAEGRVRHELRETGVNGRGGWITCGVRTRPEAAKNVLRTLVTFVWLKTLNASAMSCSFARSVKANVRDTRGSTEIMPGIRKVLRPKPGARSLRLFPSLFKSALVSAV